MIYTDLVSFNISSQSTIIVINIIINNHCNIVFSVPSRESSNHVVESLDPRKKETRNVSVTLRLRRRILGFSRCHQDPQCMFILDLFLSFSYGREKILLFGKGFRESSVGKPKVLGYDSMNGNVINIPSDPFLIDRKRHYSLSGEVIPFSFPSRTLLLFITVVRYYNSIKRVVCDESFVSLDSQDIKTQRGTSIPKRFSLSLR